MKYFDKHEFKHKTKGQLDHIITVLSNFEKIKVRVRDFLLSLKPLPNPFPISPLTGSSLPLRVSALNSPPLLRRDCQTSISPLLLHLDHAGSPLSWCCRRISSDVVVLPNRS